MWFARSSEGCRGFFIVKMDDGALRPGLVDGDFDVTVVAPDNSATLSPVVQEVVTKPGLYFFDVNSSFLLNNGTGQYGVVIEVNTESGPSGSPHVTTSTSRVLNVSHEDFDTLSKPGDEMALVSADKDSIISGVWDQDVAQHNSPGSTGVHLSRMDVNVSTRASPGDVMSISASEVADAVWDASLDDHSIAGSSGEALLESSDGAIDVESVADAVWSADASQHAAPGTTGEAQNRLDANVSTRATPGDVPSASDVRDSVWNATVGDYTTSGSAGEHQSRLDTPVSSRSTPGDIPQLSAIQDSVWGADADSYSDPGTTGEQLNSAASVDNTSIAEAVWDADLSTHATAGSTGEAQNRLDASVSSRAQPGDLMSISFSGVADAVWDSSLSEYLDAGSTGEALNKSAEGVVDASAIASAVWDSDLQSHVVSGTTGEAQNRLDTSVSSRASAGDVLDPEAVASAVWDADQSNYTVQGSLGALLGDMRSTLEVVGGLVHDNTVIDDQTYDNVGNLLSARIRHYVDATSAELAGSSGLLSTHRVSATYVSGRLNTYTVVREE